MAGRQQGVLKLTPMGRRVVVAVWTVWAGSVSKERVAWAEGAGVRLWQEESGGCRVRRWIHQTSDRRCLQWNVDGR